MLDDAGFTDTQIFVTGVTVLSQQGQTIYQPQIQASPMGTQLTIQAVISADRRFVRMSLSPTLTNLATPEVQLFPIVTPIFPLLDGTATGQPIVFTQFIQQPVITSVGVQTTVAVPDGGTVLMGGLKRLSEGRNEFGPPVLSKITYSSGPRRAPGVYQPERTWTERGYCSIASRAVSTASMASPLISS